LALLGPASAAILEGVAGKVLVNNGGGYNRTSTGAVVQPGDRVLVESGGTAVIVYDNGCKVRVKPITIATVEQDVTCHAKVVETEATGGNIGIGPIVTGGVILGGVVAGVILLYQHSQSISP
jgi:hypothetical protein